MYSVSFPSQLHASKFLQLISPLPKEDTQWVDPRDAEESKHISFKADKSAQQQLHGRAFAPHYLKIKKLLADSSNFADGMGLQVDTARGTLQVISKFDLWELGKVELERGVHTLRPNKANLGYFSLPLDIFGAAPEDNE